MKEHLPEDIAKKMYQQYQDGQQAQENGKTDYSVEDADQAIVNAKKEKEEDNIAQDKANEDQVQDAEKEKAESPIQVVLQLKQNAVLGMTIPDMSSVSSNAVELKDTVSKRQCETGTYHAKKTEKLNVLTVLWCWSILKSIFQVIQSQGREIWHMKWSIFCVGKKQTDKT